MKLVIKKIDNTWDVIDVLQFYRIPEEDQEGQLDPKPEPEPSKTYTPRRGNSNFHNNKYYKSVFSASKDTGEHRYWIQKYCDNEIGGWKWAK